MNGDAGLVSCLVDRLATRLPHRTGNHSDHHLQHDEVVVVTRATLVKVSVSSIAAVLDPLVSLLADLARPYKSSSGLRPPHILLSELYVLGLIADCCSSHWLAVLKPTLQGASSPTTLGSSTTAVTPSATTRLQEVPAWERGKGPIPAPLGDSLVQRLLDAIKANLSPLPDGYLLPPRTILDDGSTQRSGGPLQGYNSFFPDAPRTPLSARSDDPGESAAELLETRSADTEICIKAVVEFVTATSWQAAFEYFRGVVYSMQSAVSPAGSGPVASNSLAASQTEEERTGLVIIRLVSAFWVDKQKLGSIIQEMCSSFLHFRKPAQNAVAIATPVLIARWIDRCPQQFVQLHTSHQRFDGGADTLFDMAHTAVDNARRKGVLHPFQTALLLLLPDVFEVASNLRDAKSGGLAKKVAFLDGLRKGLRSRQDQAAYSLVSLLRASRHFDAESDSALVSYAMDVQDEVRDAVFRRYAPSGTEGAVFDQDILTAAFVSLAHLSFDTCVEVLGPACLASSAPQPFKVAVIQACSHFARLRDSERYQPLFAATAPFVQSQLKSMSTLISDVYIGENPSLHRRPSDSGSSLSVLCNLLHLLDASPSTLFQGAPSQAGDREQFFDDTVESFTSCVIAADDAVRCAAVKVARRIFSDEAIVRSVRSSKRLDTQMFKEKFWRLTSLVLMSMCDKVGPYDLDSGLRTIHGYLESRLLLLTSMPMLSNLSEEIPERTTASIKLETLFLVSLCSADLETCQLVTSCIGLFLEECRVIDTASKGARSSSTLLHNSEIFDEIASRQFRFTGLVAFQRRINGLLRRLQYPSGGILSAWEIAFDKWLHLSKDVSAMSPEAVSEKMVAEWRNYSGFLASLGGICTADNAAIREEPSIVGLRWIDRLSSENQEEALLHRYFRLCTQLLACGNARVRETMREVLSTEVSPLLYQPLFKALESELDVLFTGALEPSVKGQDSEIVFAEQAASLLRALVERLDSPSDLGAASSVHLGSLTLNFAKFLDGVPDTSRSLLVKIKICQLCEAVTKRKEHLNLRDDVRIRNQLLEYIFSWIARPRSSRGNDAATNALPGGGRLDESARVQRDLDRACLKSLAELTYRLPLQPGDGQTDAGTSELKSQMFHTYFNRFLSLLNPDGADVLATSHGTGTTRDDSQPASEIAITILSNLLSANIDVGLKHSLSIGYHENVEIRTAFIKVLCNILVQGTEFNNLSDTAVSEKYDELLVLLTQDSTLAAALSSVCPSPEVDELTISLLNIYEKRGLSFVLIEALIKQEVEDTDNESELLRRTCVATKMLSVYAKWKGSSYLKATLGKVVERLVVASKDLDLELDPARVTSQEELQKNALQLRIVAKVFIDDICASSTSIPPAFRKICSIISDAVTARFPDAKYTAVGAFIFLRFFCPAIVAPDIEGLVTTTPSKEIRRGLLLIAKVIQNLANNVLFGAKEPYMFPLNDFLAQNIYHVTTFLREISVAPDAGLPPPNTESFDFGSCVSLHRFLYDHWDHVRQRLVSRERRDFVRSPAIEAVRGRSPVLEPLRNLITNLGPPPLAVTWNRPQLSANTPPAYSRFQDFMLRNAFRSTESFVTARAVYDGGESKDGISIICVILRNIDAEAIDYETLIYCYLKIASRLWHRPFGLLIDATCYNGHNEPQDDLFQMLELLTPSELFRNLSRIYVYNMNSAFRKCFRRMLRVSVKNEQSVLNPRNVEYHLIGSLQDLQTHFHLSQLHLPKETISVVTDTRYVFQPITRLSKSKGNIEVVIKVGSQFVQVTTTKKQDIYQGFRLSTTVNDIFRLGEVDEAPTSIQSVDDSAFGLRTDNGKIVMYFTSPKKTDVLQAIRGAKAKHGKDTRAMKVFDRLIRPQDVPGTLLNLALTNIASPDHMLRLSSYNLLGALCKAFKFQAAQNLMCNKDILVPLDPSRFIVGISKKLAETEPQLTSDFLNEFFVGWDSFSDEQKPLSLAYMAPWLPGLRTSLLVSETESDKGREKIAALLRKLIDVALSDASLSFSLEQIVWPAIYQDELLLDILLEEIIKTALSLGLHDEQTEVLTAVVDAIGTITLRGKIIARLRKALNRSSLRPTKYLPDNTVWAEICVLLQFCVSLSFDSGVQAQLYLPEIFHIVTMLANTGSADVRFLVHRLLINSIHAVCTSFALDEHRLNKLRGILESLSEPRGDIFFPGHAAALLGSRDAASMSTNQEMGGSVLSSTDSLAALLFEVCAVAAPSVDLANSWRSRWMSLVASTAFQNNPAIQPRAFTVMGCLAREEVDDDLLYQVLVALRNSVGRFGEDSNSEMLVAIVTSLSKMMAKLPSASRYGLQLFWLAMSLLRLVPPALFNCTALFLESVLTNISTSGDMRGEKMVPYLLQGRVQLEDAALPLDEMYGIHFRPDNFHFAASACLLRGLADSLTKATAFRVLATFLEMTTANNRSRNSVTSSTNGGGSLEKTPADVASSPYMALIVARAATADELKETLWHAGISPAGVPNSLEAAVRPGMIDIAMLKDKDLLLNTAMELVDFQYLDDGVQNRTLLWLTHVAAARPGVVMHLCAPIMSVLDDVLLHCQNSTTLESAHGLLQTLSASPKFAQAAAEASSSGSPASGGVGVLHDILEDMGFAGLWRSCSLGFGSGGAGAGGMAEVDRECFGMTEKLIELIII